MPNGRVALVTGANRGIGREVVRQLLGHGYRTILTARDEAKGRAAATGLGAEFLQLDVGDDGSVERCLRTVEASYRRLDVLVNNAAIHYDPGQRGTDADLTVVHEAFETNLFGAWRTCQRAVPLMRRNAWGRIVNVSSEGGSLASMGGGTPAYSVSKAAMNALTRVLAGSSGAAASWSTPSARAGSRPTWAGREDGPCGRAPRASCGPCCSTTTGPPAGSSGTGGGSPGDARTGNRR